VIAQAVFAVAAGCSADEIGTDAIVIGSDVVDVNAGAAVGTVLALKFVHLALPGFRYASANMGWPLPRAGFVVFIPSLNQAMTTGIGKSAT